MEAGVRELARLEYRSGGRCHWRIDERSWDSTRASRRCEVTFEEPDINQHFRSSLPRCAYAMRLAS